MTPREFAAAVTRDIKAMMTGDVRQYRAIVRDSTGESQVVNVEGYDLRDAASRAEEFGDVLALWVTP